MTEKTGTEDPSKDGVPIGVLSPEKALEALQEYVDVGMLEYVVPSEPLGERWVIGVPTSRILILRGVDEVHAFLAGVTALADFMRSRTPGS